MFRMFRPLSSAFRDWAQFAAGQGRDIVELPGFSGVSWILFLMHLYTVYTYQPYSSIFSNPKFILFAKSRLNSHGAGINFSVAMLPKMFPQAGSPELSSAYSARQSTNISLKLIPCSAQISSTWGPQTWRIQALLWTMSSSSIIRYTYIYIHRYIHVIIHMYIYIHIYIYCKSTSLQSERDTAVCIPSTSS